MTRARKLSLLLLTAGLLAAAPAPAAEDDAWSLLRSLRARLEAAARTAEFSQEFLPAGFSSGEREVGRLTLALPDCLRWDYLEPYPKSYLLCGDTVWSWNEGETSGRTFTVDPERERGLDLLRLSVAKLAERYDAEVAAAEAGATTVLLRPREAAGEITEATLTLAPGGDRLLGLAYRDVEGNDTRFVFDGYRPLTDRTVLWPPDGLTWIEE